MGSEMCIRDRWRGTLTNAAVGRVTVRLTKIDNTTDFVLPNNDEVRILLSANNNGVNFFVIAVRWSLTADEYRHIGSTESSSGSSLTEEQERIVNASTSTQIQDVIATTQYGGGFLLRTESSANVVRDSAGDEVALSALGQVTTVSPSGTALEELVLSGGIWTVTFNSGPDVDFTSYNVGDSLIMRLANGFDSPTPEHVVPPGDYLVFVGAPASGLNVLNIDPRSVRGINADGTLRNHLFNWQRLEAFTVPFTAPSMTFFEADYQSELELSATNNTTEFGFSDAGIRTNESVIINGTHQTSESLASSLGTAIAGTYPAFWPLDQRGYALTVTGADFSGITTGSPFLIRVTTNSGQGIIPVGNYICLLYTSPSPRDS